MAGIVKVVILMINKTAKFILFDMQCRINKWINGIEQKAEADPRLFFFFFYTYIKVCVCICETESDSCSVVSSSLQPNGLLAHQAPLSMELIL